MSEYSLPTPRDDDGRPKPVDHEYVWKGERYKLQMVPPDLDEIEEFSDLGDDLSRDELEPIVDKHLVKPDYPVGQLTLEDLNAFVHAIHDYAEDGNTPIAEQAREGLDARDQEPGN